MNRNLISAFIVFASLGAAMAGAGPGRPGYTDTPMLPAGKWHVHDPNRPEPPILTPGESFSDGAPAPADAVVLFDGKDLNQWTDMRGQAPRWLVTNGYMQVVPKAGDIKSKQLFGDFQLHVEWREPDRVVTPPNTNISSLRGAEISQGIGNSGVFLHGLYEIQVLDCYQNPTYPDGQTGAVYSQSPPLVNVDRKPGEWQTYDIIFEGPRFDADKKLLRPADVTIIQNGVVIHHHQAILGRTINRQLSKYRGDEPERGPIELQEHGNLVRFRNIWVREIKEEEQP